MTGFEQFLFVLLPIVILAGGIAAALLRRFGARDVGGRRGPGPRLPGPHAAGRRGPSGA